VRRLAVVGATLAVLLLSVGVGAQQAHAGNLLYCEQQIAGGTSCAGTNHSLTGNEAFNFYGTAYKVCAGAYLYGSYICGSLGYAEHCYSGDNVLAPLILNNETFTQHMYGYEYWGTDPCP
jgi:hypothetical protein